MSSRYERIGRSVSFSVSMSKCRFSPPKKVFLLKSVYIPETLQSLFSSNNQ
uniref:Uncharacterized protein n=1 Tax=Anguilla anguilla TaxID=7936 RepID=A0A0E9PUU7_ANGAN